MKNIILISMMIGWCVGVLLALSILIHAFIKKDKDRFETGIYMMALFGLTGYLTFFPIILALLIFNRFSNSEKPTIELN